MAVVSVVLLLCLFALFGPLAASQAAETERPVFTEEPSDSLNVIAKSAFLKCKTKHVLNAWFECSEDARFIEKQQSMSNYVDPSDGVRHIELQLEVKRVQNPLRSSSLLAEDPLGPMFLVECWCYAYGSHQTIISRKASLQFSNTPSVPEPPVLAVSPPPASSPASPSSSVVIAPKSLDGGWSTWSPWSVCSHECQQVKRRSCTNPSPRHGGAHCSGADFHMRNCTGGMCRKLDLYRKEKADSTLALGFDVYLLALVSTAIFLILSALFLLFLVKRRTATFTKSLGSNVENVVSSSSVGSTDATPHSIHVLLQQHSAASLLHPPDLIRSGAGDKMQLISRLNNLDSNVLEHLIVRSNKEQAVHFDTRHGHHHSHHHVTHHQQQQKQHLSNALSHSQQQQQQQQQQKTLSGSMSTTDNSSTSDSEPDYAEPVITNSPFCTPERRPPLPRSTPPVHHAPLAQSNDNWTTGGKSSFAR